MKGIAVVLAAGQGKRMRSQMPKVLHPLAGVPILVRLLERLRAFGFERILVVLGQQSDRVSQVLEGLGVEIVLQAEQLGTGHALLQTRSSLSGFQGTLIVANGDTPLIREETLEALMGEHVRRGAEVTLLSATLDHPRGYGRVVRGRSGRVARIVEERDCSDRERMIREINTGIYAFEAPRIFTLLSKVQPDNAQNEYYLTDVVREAIRRKIKVAAIEAADPTEVLGINSRSELALAEREIQRRIAERWMEEGVTFVRPQDVLVGSEVKIGRDTVLYPGTVLEGKSVLGAGCTVRASRIVDSTLGEGVIVKDFCVIEGSYLEQGVSVGPFTHLRPGTVLKKGVKVGNFVEVKASQLGEGTKANHLSYIGDATVGSHVNVGAGTVTCNYDGFKKFRTTIADGAFIGSGTQLVAPVEVGEGAVIGAGSTVTQNVPADALALSRNHQVNREGWAKKRRLKNSGKREGGPPSR